MEILEQKTMTQIKILFRFELAEERISYVKHQSIKIIQFENKKKD